MISGEPLPVARQHGRRGDRRHGQPGRRGWWCGSRRSAAKRRWRRSCKLVETARSSKPAGAAAGGSDRGRLRAGGAGHRAAHRRSAGTLGAAHHWGGAADVGHDREGGLQRADHRLPLRAGPGGAGGADGRDRPGREARDSHPRHRRPADMPRRSTRWCSTRPERSRAASRWSRGSAARWHGARTSCCALAAGAEQFSEHPLAQGDRRRGAANAGRLVDPDELQQRTGLRRRRRRSRANHSGRQRRRC